MAGKLVSLETMSSKTADRLMTALDRLGVEYEITITQKDVWRICLPNGAVSSNDLDQALAEIDEEDEED